MLLLLLLLVLVVVVVVVVVGSDIRSTHPPSVFNIFGFVCFILFRQTETKKGSSLLLLLHFSLLKDFRVEVGGIIIKKN